MQKRSGTKHHDEFTQGANSPLSGPNERADEHRSVLLKAAGEVVTARQVSSLTGLSFQEVDEMRGARELLALKIDADWAFPAFQFNEDTIDPLMSAVLKAHKEDHPWTVLDILLTKDQAFMGKSILQLIQDKDHRSLTRYLAQVEGDGFS